MHNLEKNYLKEKYFACAKNISRLCFLSHERLSLIIRRYLERPYLIAANLAHQTRRHAYAMR